MRHVFQMVTETWVGGEAFFYTYDANGNVAIKGDAKGLITRYSYDYEPLGRQLKKITGGITTYYLYADEGLVAEFDGSGDQQQAYGYVPSSPWGTNPLYTKTNTGYAFYHTDHLGTPQMLTLISGAKVWEGSADAFGQMTVATQTIANNLRFPGQYYDQESGQYYNYFRNYDPTTGRNTERICI